MNRTGFSSGIFHGGLSEGDRDELLSEFRKTTEPYLLLMSLSAGATGLNLQEADVVVFFDRWWNPAVENQAVHRAYRFGRDRSLLVYRFIVADTIEERIDSILKEKNQLFEAYVDSADSAHVVPFSRQELRRILEL